MKLFDVLNEEGVVDWVDNRAIRRNAKEAVDMEDGAITANHGGIVGTLVDKHPQDRDPSSSRCNVTERAINGCGNINITYPKAPQMHSPPTFSAV